jgi:carboxymethylenebutenolidase
VEIITERVKTGEGVEGYLARPREGKWPGVILHHELFGVNEHIESVVQRLAQEGYAVLAPDYYWRLPRRTAPYSDVKGAFGLALTLTDQQVLADAGSCIRYLQSQGFVEGDAVGTLGFCMGGRLAVLTAAAYPRQIDAAVSFYGGGLAGENRRDGQTLNPMDEAAKVRCPLLLIYGEIDQHITAEHVDKFTSRLKELGRGFQSYIYPGAGHGFFCNDRPSYKANAAADAWQKTLDFLHTNLMRNPAPAA